MKQSEIQVGTEYATGHGQHDYGRKRALVTGPAEQVKVYKRGSYYGSRLERQFPVEYLDDTGRRTGKTAKLPSRQIHEKWALYAARKTAEAQRQRESATIKVRQQAERAERGLVIIEGLNRLGLEASHAYLTGTEADFLESHGYPVQRTEGTPYLVAPYAHQVDSYVRRGGNIALKDSDLIALLDDAR